MFKYFFVEKTKNLLPGFFIIGIFLLFVLFFNINSINAIEVLVDGDFSTATSSSSLQTNDPGQDWYESRQQVGGITLLSLDETDVSGNSTKKAKMTGSASYNTYITQELPSTITSGDFTLQYDIYVDAVINTANAYDNSAFTFIGTNVGGSPNGADTRRWGILAFRKDGG